MQSASENVWSDVRLHTTPHHITLHDVAYNTNAVGSEVEVEVKVQGAAE